MLLRLARLSLLFALCSLPVLAQEPEANAYWPHELRLPDELFQTWSAKDKRALKNLKKKGHHIQVWAPEGATQLRAVMLIPNNTDSVHIGEHPALREVAKKQHIGMIHLANFSGAAIERADPPDFAEESFTTVLELAAEATGIEDFKHAPWITLGKSSRGRFPFRTAWWNSERVIASISYHGEVPTWPMANWSTAKDESILHCSINGLSEWDGTWYRAVRPGLLNYHHHTDWLGHQVVILGVDHGYYPDYYLYPTFRQPMPQKMPGVPKLARCQRTWDYIAAFVDSAMNLRVESGAFPEGAPMKLKQVERDSGLLIHPRAIEEILGLKWFMFRKKENGDYDTVKWPDEVTPVYDEEQGRIPFDQLVKRAKDVPEAERSDYLWIADTKLLSAWLDLHNTYKVKERILESLK